MVKNKSHIWNDLMTYCNGRTKPMWNNF